MEKVHIKQSPNDNRAYQHLTLDNGLTVLLVKDSCVEKSAAALTINVGHFDDPADYQGMAHFLEHMLFLGSENYPDPGEYQQFISQYGGSHNAWTGTEHSHFYFDIDTPQLSQALSRFADMFCRPLFTAAYVEKERHAIEAEYSLKLKDDSRRIYQVHKETVNPAHPFAKFSVGNLNTLTDKPEQTLRDALWQFYRQQYSASRMSLCVVSPCPLSTMAQWIQQFFSALPATLPAKAPLAEPLYLPEHQAVLLNIRPHKNSERLVASFALPDIQPWYAHKIVSFLASLLGDESDGSLLSYLKNAGLVNQLSAGGGIDGSNYKDFTVSFELTRAGRADTTAILKALYSALARIKQQPLPQQLYFERQRLLHWSFIYQEPADALQTASQLSVNLHHYPVQDTIFGDYRMELPPEALYQELLSWFRPDNMRLMLIAPDVPVLSEAKWYNTPYSVTKLSDTLLQTLQDTGPVAEITLPGANPYLTEQLSLLDKTEHMVAPERIYHDAHLSIWYKADTEFNTPKGHIFLQLSLPKSIADNRQLATSRLWLELFQDHINQQLYTATNAGLSYNLHVQKQGISIHTSGLAANQIQLLQNILQQINTACFSELRFNELKQQLCRHWANSSKSKPVARLFSQLSALLQPINPEIEVLVEQLEPLSFDQFNQFSTQLLDEVHLEALLVGNWSRDNADALQLMLQKWQSQQASPGHKIPAKTYSIAGTGPVWLQTDTDSTDHALVVYLAAEQASAEQMALFMLANHLMSPHYFHQLRTEQQMGYLVGTGYVPINTLPGMAFYIQSPNFECTELYQATVTFFREFLQQIKEMSDPEFAELKMGLTAQLAERDTSLGSRAKRLWLALGQDDTSFDLTGRIISALAKLTRQQFAEMLQQLLASDYDMLLLASGANSGFAHIKTVNRDELRQVIANR
ncbi:insulinase family protein [Arsukibacterium indicum]|uniref:Protease 3 n=1 Tax=Arsukibacterium indicum TaxID=2848612 RepID=A0ABS6MH51_9GAMM|nr:insulinase family protein [Arsukibacterium indicum]MBV2127661.1 insulinase family protein [Arsukibacterium indicum]